MIGKNKEVGEKGKEKKIVIRTVLNRDVHELWIYFFNIARNS